MKQDYSRARGQESSTPRPRTCLRAAADRSGTELVPTAGRLDVAAVLGCGLCGRSVAVRAGKAATARLGEAPCPYLAHPSVAATARPPRPAAQGGNGSA